MRLGSGGRGHGGAAGEEREQDHVGHGEQDPKVGAGDWQRPLRERRDQRAIETVMRQWAQWGPPPGILSDLSTPSQFSQAAQSVTQDALKGRVVLGSGPAEHIQAIERFAQAGFDHVHTHQIGPDQQSAVRLYEREILPQVGRIAVGARA